MSSYEDIREVVAGMIELHGKERALEKIRNSQTLMNFLNSYLLKTVERGDPELVKLLLEEGASANARYSYEGNTVTALHLAARLEDTSTLQILLEAGALPIRDSNGVAPVHVAVWYNRKPAVEEFCRKSDGKDSTVVNTAIMRSTRKTEVGDSKFIEVCQDGKFNIMLPSLPFEYLDGLTPLLIACMKGHNDLVDLLIQKGAEVRNSSTVTSPLIAVGLLCDTIQVTEQSLIELCEMLVSKGATMPTEAQRYYSSVLHYAVENEYPSLLKHVMDLGASLELRNKDGKTPLHVAVMKKLVRPLRDLIKSKNRNGTLDVEDDQGLTPFLLANTVGWEHGAQLLLQGGADIFSTAYLHDGLFMYPTSTLTSENVVIFVPKGHEHAGVRIPASFCAVMGNSRGCLEILEEHGKELAEEILEKSDDFRNGPITLIHFATYCNHPDILKFLLLERPSVARLINEVGSREVGRLLGGWPAVSLAVYYGYDECLDQLMKAGCQISRRFSSNMRGEFNGLTPLIQAAFDGKLEAIRRILKTERGRSALNLPAIQGWTATHTAAYYGHSSCVKELISNGADLATTCGPVFGKHWTVVDIISAYLPTDFLDGVFDTYIKPRGKDIVELDFSILMPHIKAKCRGVYENSSNHGTKLKLQAYDHSVMKVLDAITTYETIRERQTLLVNPLMDAFIHHKMKPMKTFLYSMMCLQFLATCSLSILGFTRYVWIPTFLESVMTETSTIVLCLIQVFCIIVIFFVDWRTENKWIFLKITLTFGAITMAYYDPSDHLGRCLTSAAVVMSWVEFMNISSRHPWNNSSWGESFLMFKTVTGNFAKVLSSFGLLYIGFTFSYMILFEGDELFSDFVVSFFRVFVMTQQFDYDEPFSNYRITQYIQAILARLIHLSFFFLVTVVMQNFMTAIACDEITNLRSLARARRVYEQARLLIHLEKIFKDLLRIFPTLLAEEKKIMLQDVLILNLRSDSTELPAELKGLIGEKMRKLHREEEEPSG